MTFSLVASCPRAGQVGVAAMTAMPGVGKLVAHATAGVGAAASQAMVNPYLAYDGLQWLAEGVEPTAAVQRLIEADPGGEGRQFGLVDAQGRSASHTGSLPDDWKGHRTGPSYACQGNRLAGAAVVDAAVEAFLAEPDEPLANRLIDALDAGETQGGDTKGHRSATVTVMDRDMYPLWDLRIDDADDPLAELKTQYTRLEEALLPSIRMMPTREDPLGGFNYEGTANTV